jgi:ABC-type dipeptide/oligopeptide/nickel transport system ATPase subunit
MSGATSVEVRNLSRTFQIRGHARDALIDVSFRVTAGKTLAVVGESGAGKSTLGRLITGLDQPSAGDVLIDGAPLRLRSGRPSPVQMVFQHPADALNPRWSIGRAVGEPLKHTARTVRDETVARTLERVGLDPQRAGQRATAFSGGQLQRVVVARALIAEPSVLVCDEPTSALDVSVQAQIVNLLMSAQREREFACILITHDLAVARSMADDILVLRNGRVVEHAPADAFFEGPADPYASSLLRLAAEQAVRREGRLEQHPQR